VVVTAVFTTLGAQVETPPVDTCKLCATFMCLRDMAFRRDLGGNFSPPDQVLGNRLPLVS